MNRPDPFNPNDGCGDGAVDGARRRARRQGLQPLEPQPDRRSRATYLTSQRREGRPPTPTLEQLLRRRAMNDDRRTIALARCSRAALRLAGRSARRATPSADAGASAAARRRRRHRGRCSATARPRPRSPTRRATRERPADRRRADGRVAAQEPGRRLGGRGARAPHARSRAADNTRRSSAAGARRRPTAASPRSDVALWKRETERVASTGSTRLPQRRRARQHDRRVVRHVPSATRPTRTPRPTRSSRRSSAASRCCAT